MWLKQIQATTVAWTNTQSQLVGSSVVHQNGLRTPTHPSSSELLGWAVVFGQNVLFRNYPFIATTYSPNPTLEWVHPANGVTQLYHGQTKELKFIFDQDIRVLNGSIAITPVRGSVAAALHIPLFSADVQVLLAYIFLNCAAPDHWQHASSL